MIKRIFAVGTLVPLLVLLFIWAHENAQRVERKTDYTVCMIREKC
jgi:hypothetical protein